MLTRSEAELIERRSREWDDENDLPGDECPVDHDPGISPGEAQEAWHCSGGMCELCNEQASYVDRFRGRPTALCDRCRFKTSG